MQGRVNTLVIFIFSVKWGREDRPCRWDVTLRLGAGESGAKARGEYWEALAWMCGHGFQWTHRLLALLNWV